MNIFRYNSCIFFQVFINFVYSLYNICILIFYYIQRVSWSFIYSHICGFFFKSFIYSSYIFDKYSLSIEGRSYYCIFSFHRILEFSVSYHRLFSISVFHISAGSSHISNSKSINYI